MAIEYKPLNQNRMKAKRVTVSFEYTSFDCLEIMIDRLKSELMEGKEYFEDMVEDQNENKRYLQFMQEYKKTRNFVVNKDVIIIKSKV
jgi:hypothetical protein